MERDLVEKPMDELQGTALQYSCVTAASRGTLRKGEKRVCIFCDKTYAGGPSVIADHIMHPSGSKIAACVPKLEWLQRFNEVSAEMKRRKSGPGPYSASFSPVCFYLGYQVRSETAASCWDSLGRRSLLL